MKTINKQSGFFDFGIGLGLLALFGGTAVVVSPEEAKETVVVEQQIQVEPPETPAEITVVQTRRRDETRSE